jgi:hypothetical protein
MNVSSLLSSSQRDLKNITLANGYSDTFLVEGTIGELVQATFAEGIILEVVGKKGVIRIDLGEGEIKKTIERKTKAKSR